MHKGPGLDDLKSTRRTNLAALLDVHGQKAVADATGIDAAYLWQMAKGEGKNRRGVSDANARRIEEAMRLPAGALDQSGSMPVNEPLNPPAGSVASVSHAMSKERLTLALQLVEEALAERHGTLPPPKKAELALAIYELLEEGLQQAKVLRFARAAVA